MSDTKQGAAIVPPLDLEAIKKTIRERHALRLDSADPILAVATLIELMTERTAERYTAALSSTLAAQIEDAKGIAEAIVNKGADHVAGHAQAAITAIVDDAVGRFRDEASKALQLQAEMTDAQSEALNRAAASARWAWWGAFASLLLGGAFVGLIIGSHL